MKQYILSAVYKNGISHSTSLSGYLAEHMCDQQFAAMKASNRYQFITLMVDGAVRAQHFDDGKQTASTLPPGTIPLSA